MSHWYPPGNLIGELFASSGYQTPIFHTTQYTASDTGWYKNLRKTPTIRLAARGKTFTTSARLLTDEAQVGEVAQKFREKYGARQVKAYYPRLDVAVEVSLE